MTCRCRCHCNLAAHTLQHYCVYRLNITHRHRDVPQPSRSLQLAVMHVMLDRVLPGDLGLTLTILYRCCLKNNGASPGETLATLR